MRKILFCILCLGLFVACNKPQKTTTNTSTPKVETATNEETGPATTVQNIGGILGDDTMFPFVYVESINKLRFEAYTMKFSLEHPKVLIPLNNTDTPWINPDGYSEFNGQFVTYIRSGREAKLENPYIMAQYINKNLPSCGTIDSVYMWLDAQFLEKGAKGEVTAEVYEVKTASGKKAICKEYKTPKTPAGKAGKSMGYAYIDFNDTYLIGLNLTALSATDYEVSKPDFMQLVKSFSLK